ncbi:MAG: histidine kinase [Hirschia sp.]|nr:histidine kinase [Hirschia sp.]MBF19305.1 histidine kinase [Hirschia sp.]
MAKAKIKKAPAKDAQTRDVHTPIPSRVLTVLLIAFGGALGLKAWEERRASDDAHAAQQARESMAIASIARAELVRIQTRFETALQLGSDSDAAAKLANVDTPERMSPATPTIAELANGETFRIYAKDSNERWWSASAEIKHLLPAPRGDRSFKLVDTRVSPSGVRFEADGLSSRTITACSPLTGSKISACVTRTIPMLTSQDYNRFLIYLLLLAAPALAVIGLIRTARTNSIRLNHENASRTRLETRWQELDLGGANGVWTVNDQDHTINLRKQARDMLGMETGKATIPISNFVDMMDQESASPLRSKLERGAAGGEFQMRFQVRGIASGRHFEMRGGPTDDGLGGIIYDITEAVRTEARSKQIEVLARTAVEAFPGPFAAWDSRNRLLFWNSGFQHIFEIPPGVMRAGASYDAIMAEAHKQIRVERPSPSGNGREFLLLSDLWITFQSRPMANGGKISVGLDISALKEQEEHMARSEKKLKRLVADLNRSQGQAEVLAMKLAEEKAKAERASQSKSVFLASMSHELRTPLNAINGFSEMLLNEVYGELGDARYKGYAQDILDSGQHLLDMINDILDMAKIEAGKMQISRSLIDPEEAVDSAVRMIRRRAEEKNITLEMKTLNEVPDIEVDHRAVKQMVLNLVSNAIKFTDQGGKITISLMRQDRFVAVSVEDNGIGIPKQDISRLTTPFEQSSADENRNSQGTGLGLALTRSFAEMHGGKLVIESELNVGTRVTFILPISPPAKKPKTKPAPDS